MGIKTPRTEVEVEDVIATAYEIKDDGYSKYPGMSYEDGVIAALDWVKGENDETPFEEN